ncbi:MAG TPA: O-antigen ligase family protein [Chloroflexota bacterium]|nr:O-antigen ligase family protein [Chloroflexota bacterium]
MTASGLAPSSRYLAARVWRSPVLLVLAALLSAAGGWYGAQRSPFIVAGGVVGGAAGVWALRRWQVALTALLAVVVLLPFGVVPVRLGVAPTLLDLATGTLLVVWLARAAVGRSSVRITATGFALVAAMLAWIVAYVFSPDPLRPDETARTFIKLVAAHIAFLPVVSLVHGHSHAKRITVALVVLASIQALVGIALYFAPRHIAYRALAALATLGYPSGDSVLRYRPDTELLRATGTAVDPNMLGVLLMVTGAIAATQLVAQRPCVPRAWAAAALAPISLCLLLTESRGSWLGLAGGLLAVAGLRYRFLWLAFTLAAVGAAFTPGAARFTGHLFAGLRAQDRASSMRIGEIENALAVIANHPWFGVGWGGGWPSVDLEFTLGVSNVFLTVAERAGLPAMALYILCWAILGTSLWPAFRRQLRASVDDGLLLGLCAALCGAGIAGMVDHHFVRFPHLVTLLWVVAALAVAVALDPQEAPGARMAAA